MWRLRQLALVLALALAASAGSARALNPTGSCRLWTDHPGTRQQLTAAFLSRLSHFVDWPADPPAGQFVIGILHDEEVATALEAMASTTLVDGRAIEVRRLASASDIVECRIAFLGPGESCLLPNLLTRAAQAHVLTVSGAPDFARRGGVIALVPDGCNLHFEINPEAARCANLRVSSKLLTLATLVSADPR